MSAGIEKLLALILPLALLAGCASTPEASRSRDAEAKQFVSHPATAAIYVYRNDSNSLDDDSVLYLDHRLVGATLRGTYFRIDAQPGKHVLHGLAYDAGQLEIDVRPGEIYFVLLKVLGGTSRFAQRNAETGRRELLACCAMLENWAPGQRPLLR
jgi:hypothetical protein